MEKNVPSLTAKKLSELELALGSNFVEYYTLTCWSKAEHLVGKYSNSRPIIWAIIVS